MQTHWYTLAATIWTTARLYLDWTLELDTTSLELLPNITSRGYLSTITTCALVSESFLWVLNEVKKKHYSSYFVVKNYEKLGPLRYQETTGKLIYCQLET